MMKLISNQVPAPDVRKEVHSTFPGTFLELVDRLRDIICKNTSRAELFQKFFFTTGYDRGLGMGEKSTFKINQFVDDIY